MKTNKMTYDLTKEEKDYLASIPKDEPLEYEDAMLYAKANIKNGGKGYMDTTTKMDFEFTKNLCPKGITKKYLDGEFRFWIVMSKESGGYF